MVEWFLYVILESSSGDLVLRTAQPNQTECLKAAAAARINVSHGAESERAVVIFCGGREIQRHYGSAWWRDAVKDAP